jgi:hypothetical protein
VYIAHALVERHSPNLSVRRESFESQFAMDEMNAQREELDEQLRFYDQMLGKTPYRIYMSDHGAGRYRHQKMHVHFQVYHDSWVGRDTDRLFCFLDFDRILYRLIEKKEINDNVWSREYVPIQDVDIYNWYHLIGYVKHSYAPYITAFKGVITGDFMYVHYKSGEEFFYKWSDGSDIPQIELKTPKDNVFISELRRKAGSFPEELDTDSRFRYAKYTYKVCGNIRKTMEAVTLLVNALFDTYADGSIAFRMGGEHSFQLHSILTETSRRKIGGIIDANEKCKCSRLGYHIYHTADDMPKGITAILLSSYCHVEELRKEAQLSYGAYKIIDLYQYLGQNGYHFTDEFYYGLESDWDVGFPKDDGN